VGSGQFLPYSQGNVLGGISDAVTEEDEGHFQGLLKFVMRKLQGLLRQAEHQIDL